jgi:hypothetical protein
MYLVTSQGRQEMWAAEAYHIRSCTNELVSLRLNFIYEQPFFVYFLNTVILFLFGKPEVSIKVAG